MHLLNIGAPESAAMSFSTPPFRRCPPSSPSIAVPFPRVPTSLKCAFEIEARCTATSAEMTEDGTVTAEATAAEMVFEQILEEGVFRFDCPGNDRDAAFPSLSFADPEARETAITANGKVPEFIPTFESLYGQQIVKIQLPLGTSFYGTGEVSGQLERTGKRIFTWNTDAWGYSPGTTSLYQSHPWVLAVLPGGKALGVLADTARRCEVDLRESSAIKFVSTVAYPVITFGPFKSPTEVLISLSHAIGTVFMPPKWSLGYHQCRWSYETDDRVRKIATNFRKRGIPCDVIWMDIDYMHGFRCFTFDKGRFPDPKALVKDLHAIGIKAIWMLDPGIKYEEGYHVYDSGSNNNIWIQKEDGKPFVGEVWPGPCVFPDFTWKEARLWWANLVKDFVSSGVDGIWNDMNEPAIFKTVTKTMPESNIHNADAEIGGRQTHAHYHNVYGMLMARSTYEGMKMANEKKRPFVLTRAGYIGSQRYAATWTGDNLSNWEHLHMSIPMVLQLGLSGQPLSGPDIGGFSGNATPRLFGRWMGVGSMFPFCRAHSEAGTIDQEPWSFGKECEEVCRLSLLRRYRLIPHIYTLFYQAHTKGTLVLSPTFFADPTDKKLRNVENSFLLGSLLVCTSTIPERGSHELSHELPNGTWMRFDFGDSHPDLPILYLQGGSIIPVGPPLQHLGEASPTDDLSLFVALDISGKAKGVLFEDDGDGYGYTQGAYLLTYYAAELKSSTVTVRVSRTEGSWRRPNRTLHVHILLGEGAMIDGRGIDGEEVHITMPSESEVSKLIFASETQYRDKLDKAKLLPDADNLSGQKGFELSKTPVEIKSRDWQLKVVPWIGGRVISMIHLPSATQWLHSRVEIDGYEEYSGADYRSAGCYEEYKVTGRNFEQSDEEEALSLEGDIGGGLVLERKIFIPKDNPQILCIDSGIIARTVGAGSGGFSRLVCLRVHPTFTLLHPTEVSVMFKSIDGSEHEIGHEAGEKVLEEIPALMVMPSQYLSNLLSPTFLRKTVLSLFSVHHREWMLFDKCAGLGLVNRFDARQVNKCLIHWGSGTVNLELWSEERPVSKDTPLAICHEYEVKQVPKL